MVDQNGGITPQYDWQRADYRTFEFGDVIGRAFSLLKQYFLPFFITALVIVGVPALIAVVAVLLAVGTGETAGFASAPLWIGFAVSLVAAIVGSILLPAAIIFAALKGWTGDPVSMRQSVKVMLGRFWALLGLGILSGLAIGFGLMFLLVPGLILIAGWFVVTAALVMEKTSVTGAMSRSWELTKGYKWQVFAIFLIAIAIGFAVSLVAAIPSFILGVGAGVSLDANGEMIQPAIGLGYIVSQIFSSIGEIVSQLISSLIVASTYFELRRVKDGVSMNSIADIFS